MVIKFFQFLIEQITHTSYQNLFLGQIDDDINFTYDTNTDVYFSCSARLNDEMWVLGGVNQRRQVRDFLSFKGLRIATNTNILDEQSSKLQADKCWRVAF